MLDYIQQVTEFIKQHFEPSDPDRANFKRNTDQLLSFLFVTFPDGCISDYELNDIMLDLGYTRQMYVVETYHEKGEGKNKYTEIKKHLVTGWCMKSEFDLRDEDFKPLGQI